MRFGERINLHTHTGRCGRSAGSVEEYCREARRQGVALLGFSDHAPFADGRIHESRMLPGEIPEYCREIAQAAPEFPELTLLTGLEVDYLPEVGKAFYEDRYRQDGRIDYLLAGIHFLDPYRPETDIWQPGLVLTSDAVRRFVEQTVKTIETGLFDCIAHPDLFTACCPRWTPEIRSLCKEIIEAAKSWNVCLEINAYGLRKALIGTPEGARPPYPWRPFWELAAECGARVVVNADAHCPAEAWGNTSEAVAFAAACGIAPDNATLAAEILEFRAERRCFRRPPGS